MRPSHVFVSSYAYLRSSIVLKYLRCLLKKNNPKNLGKLQRCSIVSPLEKKILDGNEQKCQRGIFLRDPAEAWMGESELPKVMMMRVLDKGARRFFPDVSRGPSDICTRSENFVARRRRVCRNGRATVEPPHKLAFACALTSSPLSHHRPCLHSTAIKVTNQEFGVSCYASNGARVAGTEPLQ